MEEWSGWTGFICLKTDTNDGSSLHGIKNSGSIKGNEFD
jgi:hypothetical protein